MDAGILPVKRLDRAKARLGEAFGDDDRLAIARALMEDALDLCVRADFLTWWVVSDDDSVLALAGGRALRTLRDDGEGLNEALAKALSEVSATSARSVTIVPADVPLTSPDDLEDLLDTGATSDVVIVPSRSDGGTNGLYLRPPDLLVPAFGPGSLASHARAAEDRGLRCSILGLERMELDLDTVADVDTFLRRQSQSRTAAVLRASRGRPATETANEHGQNFNQG